MGVASPSGRAAPRPTAGPGTQTAGRGPHTIEKRSRSMRRTTRTHAQGPILVCHSHLRWDWVYQRPQHLLSRLARRWPVIVEEEPVFDARPPGLDVIPAARRGHGAPAASPSGRGLRPRRSRRGLHPHRLAATAPSCAGSSRRCSPITAIASVTIRSSFTTAWTSWRISPNAPAGLVEAEARLLARADVVFTGGRSLYESKKGRQRQRPLLPVGRRARALRPGSRPGIAAAGRRRRSAPPDLRLLRRGRRAARLRADRRARRRECDGFGRAGRAR